MRKIYPKTRIFFIIRTESSGVGVSAEAAIALVGQIFPSAVLEENFAERLVFSVPQSSVSSLARCFQQIEDGKDFDKTDWPVSVVVSKAEVCRLQFPSRTKYLCDELSTWLCYIHIYIYSIFIKVECSHEAKGTIYCSPVTFKILQGNLNG